MFSRSFGPITAQLYAMDCDILTNVKHECWVGGYYGQFMHVATAFHMKKLIISENSSMLFCFQTTLIALIRINERKKNILNGSYGCTKYFINYFKYSKVWILV